MSRTDFGPGLFYNPARVFSPDKNACGFVAHVPLHRRPGTDFRARSPEHTQGERP